MAPCPWMYLEVGKRLSKTTFKQGFTKNGYNSILLRNHIDKLEIKMMFDTLTKEASEKPFCYCMQIRMPFLGYGLTLVVSANRVSIMNYL
jgi:hypothetical protein